MKNFILILLLAGSFPAFPQGFKRCSSAEYLRDLEQHDTAFARRRLQSEAASSAWITNHYSLRGRSVIYIPVVFHLLYNDTSQYLDDAVVLSQIDVINEDYRRLNADSQQTPLAFRAVAADCEIEFCLAKRTPSGQPTNGIIHKFTTVSSFSNFDEPKFNVYGGDDSWDASRYLNIWVAAFSNPNFLGLGTFPGGDPQYDGVVINYKACGRIGNHLMQHYNKGRSVTHEIGHWLNLIHIWGDDGNTCNADDNVSDTPMQSSETYGCPSYPKTDNCSASFPGIMFMDYMDYTDDECMNMFTEGQKAKMIAAINTDRPSILTSNGCTSVGIEENILATNIVVYPNPVSDRLVIKSSLPSQLKASSSVVDPQGRIVLVVDLKDGILQPETIVDVSALARGIYFLKISSPAGQAAFKVVKE